MDVEKIKVMAKRIDENIFVTGFYFKSPLTDENSGASPSDGLFFLTGKERNCIAGENGVVYEIDINTMEFVNT